jgi:DNA excision repair protein ERCC-2
MTVAVRALCDFTARQGDLDLRFTPAPSALDGMLGHALVRARRGADYQSEVTLSGKHGGLTVRGRADGWDPARSQLEEIKTHRSDLARMPDNQRQLHWAQARVYGWLMCEQLGLSEIRIALVYFHTVSQKETVLVEACLAADLKQHFEDLCRRYLHWAQSEAAHRSARDAALTELKFPFAAMRDGQRLLARAVWRAATSKRALLAQAGTGAGKTLGTLYPLLRAMPGQGLDRAFCLSAKTPGRMLWMDALARIKSANSGLPLRVLELVARDKACEYPGTACHGEACPLARGFYDRLPAARREAVAAPLLTREALRDVALAHQVCPYYLAQDLAQFSDVVVGDYNYWFDLSAMLHAMAQQSQWHVALLVDEAHNLIERGRAMYSASLHGVSLARARKDAPATLARALNSVARQWPAFGVDETTDYRLAPLPDKLLAALNGMVSATTELLADSPQALAPALQSFFFDALHFLRVAESFGEHSIFDLQRERSGRRATLCLRNLDPAPMLAPRFGAASVCVLFSATLSPWHYYADSLGLPADLAWVDVPSPFDAGQLEVRILQDVSTRYADRAASLPQLVQVMASQYGQRPGNYLAFFSSHDYLGQALAALRARYPDIPCWEQERQMDEPARAAFLARFTEDGRGIGFAVLGGAFAEGIDLPGERLVGAFIATLGLPQLNPVNALLQQKLQARHGAGYDYAYFYPGMQKVVQAAGRVIRSETDRGVLLLMDERFAGRQARALFPAWWQPRLCRASESEAGAECEGLKPAQSSA